MNAIIFGGSGFVGSHVADMLSEAGYKVKIFDLNPSPYLKPNQEMIIGDILDENKVSKAIKGCDYIYHFAGITDIDDASTRPLDTVIQNVKGTVNLLEAASKIEAKRFIFASTIYVYSDKGGFYRCSKQAAELYAEEYQSHYGLNYTILRYGTVYGPRANYRNSIYRYLKQALNENKITASANGEEMREYIHVRDAARLSIEVLSEKYKNQRVIITGHHPMKFRDFLYAIKEILGNKIEIEFKELNSDPQHYSLTPYSFIPKIGYKLTTNCYLDLGQGLLECINEIHSFEQTKEAVKIV